MSWASRSSLEGVVDDADACGMWLDVPDSMRGVVYLVGRCGRRARASTTLLDVPSRGRRWDALRRARSAVGCRRTPWAPLDGVCALSRAVVGGRDGRWPVGCRQGSRRVRGRRGQRDHASSTPQRFNATGIVEFHVTRVHRQLKRDGVHSLTRGTTGERLSEVPRYNFSKLTKKFWGRLFLTSNLLDLAAHKTSEHFHHPHCR